MAMSAQSPAGHEDGNAVGLTETPGHRLRAARQARGLDLERIAAELHLAPAVVDALERDDHQALPGPVFVAGYLRNYARLLNMNPEPVLAAYRASTTAPAPPAAFRAPAPPATKSGGQGSAVGRIAGLVLVLALAALAVVWWQTKQPIEEPGATVEAAGVAADPIDQAPPEEEAPPPEATPPAAEDETDVSAHASPKPGPNDEPATAGPLSSKPPVSPVSAGEPSGVTAGAPSQGTEEPTTPPTDQAASGVAMEFSGPCWVDIRDSEHSYKLFGEMHAGDRRVLEGKPPYSVILGNAAAVKITVNGAPFDLTSITRGNVARFKLDPNQPH
jgi:cytoskeleton protein RodZ